jgi:hypothetical protein
MVDIVNTVFLISSIPLLPEERPDFIKLGYKILWSTSKENLGTKILKNISLEPKNWSRMIGLEIYFP